MAPIVKTKLSSNSSTEQATTRRQTVAQTSSNRTPRTLEASRLPSAAAPTVDTTTKVRTNSGVRTLSVWPVRRRETIMNAIRKATMLSVALAITTGSMPPE